MSRFYFFSLLLLALPVTANNLDIQLLALSNNAEVTQKGKTLFDSYCSGCHKKDLSGAAGFNLKDGEWIHGSQPSKIIQNLQNGFANMPGFGAALKQDQQHAIVAYILSKREGFENLTYELYQLDNIDDVTIEAKDKVKSGAIKDNFLDFELPEIPHYALVFEGDFHAPKDKKSYLFANGVKEFNLDVLIDGESAPPAGTVWMQRWLLKPGKQHVKFTFISAKSGVKWKGAQNIALYVVNDDNTIKLFPVSTRARKESKNTSYDVKASGQFVVQQKKIVKLPPYSIAVGAPEKINYAFNTRSCAINGLWSGDLLNVGPNIGGRGKDGSIPLGDWLYHFPAQLIPTLSKDQTCQFIKYRLESSPEFHFSVNKLSLSMIADTSIANKIKFIYRVVDNPDKLASISFSLPESDKLIISSSVGDINKNKLTVDVSTQSEFVVEMSWQGDK
ncbi:MAG: c-type cytochrome [Thalassotalea sp.]